MTEHVVRFNDLKSCFVNVSTNDDADSDQVEVQGFLCEWNNRKAYLSWSRCPPSARRAFEKQPPLVEIDPLFALQLGMRDEALVRIRPIQHCEECSIVDVRLKSAEDCEMIELDVDYVSSQLLTQINFVFIGETFPFWIRNSSVSLEITRLISNGHEVEFGKLLPNSEIHVQLLRRPVMKPRVPVHCLFRVQPNQIIKLNENSKEILENINLEAMHVYISIRDYNYLIKNDKNQASSTNMWIFQHNLPKETGRFVTVFGNEYVKIGHIIINEQLKKSMGIINMTTIEVIEVDQIPIKKEMLWLHPIISNKNDIELFKSVDGVSLFRLWLSNFTPKKEVFLSHGSLISLPLTATPENPGIFNGVRRRSSLLSPPSPPPHGGTTTIPITPPTSTTPTTTTATTTATTTPSLTYILLFAPPPTVPTKLEYIRISKLLKTTIDITDQSTWTTTTTTTTPPPPPPPTSKTPTTAANTATAQDTTATTTTTTTTTTNNNEDSCPEFFPVSNIIAMQDILQQIKDPIEESIRFHDYFLTKSQVKLRSNVIIYGNSGSGKSHFLRGLKSYFYYKHFIFIANINTNLLISKRVETIRKTIKNAFKLAYLHRPSVVVIDNIDILVPAQQDEHGPDNSTSDSICSFLCEMAKKFQNNSDKFVGILATAKSVSNINPYLRDGDCFDNSITIPPPTPQQRIEIATHMAVEKNIAFHHNFDTRKFGTITEGCSPRDLSLIIQRLIQSATLRMVKSTTQTPATPTTPTTTETTATTTTATPTTTETTTTETARKDSLKSLTITNDDVVAAMEGFTPISLHGIVFQQSDITFDHVGGLLSVKQLLKETFEWPAKYSELFALCPLRLRSGVLLFGPPGCGKTMIARAAATECGLRFISIKGAELLNKYIGASEKAVRDLFISARAAAPCVLFFDEFDAIAPRRGHDSTGVTDRVVNQLLTEIDGVETINNVYILAASNRPDLIDPALLRPGRLDKSVICDFPTTTERLSILVAHGSLLDLDDDVDFDVVVAKTQYYSGADLKAILVNAQLVAIGESGEIEAKMEDISTDVTSNQSSSRPIFYCATDDGEVVENATANQFLLLPQRLGAADPTTQIQARKGVVIHQRHLLQALSSTRPSVSPQDRLALDRSYRTFLQSTDTEIPEQRATLA